ncbi:hypothetical protein E1264_24065 [Actinomadura sp. KC216]|uniref:DUF6461 domain-containing protein n=1 Tax=Actinomadura sp. KC216 TaxID=2530370 RepID=UPI001051DF93|nr:DUF6461 domain-containing protein [Actinomadura sp. KC216]TDB84611.1 hypothetical protein E1264_24065 [Actinomadura sp. KC216]
MLKVTHDGVDWIDGDGSGPLGELFCLTFVKGVDETEALTRLGGLPDTMRPRTLEEADEALRSFEAAYTRYAFALNLGGWTVLIEPSGFRGTLDEPLAALSRGTEAVAVSRNDYGDHAFRYAVDGTLVTGFEPTWPDDRWGTDPDRLLGQMRAVGLDLDIDGEDDADDADDADGDDGDGGDDRDGGPEHDDGAVPSAYVPALLLAGLITGAVPHPDALAGELTSAEIAPWFTDAPPTHSYGPTDPAMIAAIQAASPDVLRAVVARETMRLASVLGLDATPGLAEAVAAAGRGEPVTVSPESELGTHVRSWLWQARQAGGPPDESIAPVEMDADEQNTGTLRHWFTIVLNAALWPEPHAAAGVALSALTDGPAELRDPAAEAAVLRTLRGDA